MDRNDQGRKEPTLADLEAFEKLLRDSLHSGAAPNPQAQTTQAVHAAQARAENARDADAPAMPAYDTLVAERPAQPDQLAHPDQLAMAELARLIDTPVDFEIPAPRRTGPAPAAHPPEPAETGPHHLQGSAQAALVDEWKSAPNVEATFSGVPAPELHAARSETAAAHDPLAAFEEELRRFDAIRLAEQHSAEAAAPSPSQHSFAHQNFERPDLRAEYPADATPGAATPAHATSHPAHAKTYAPQVQFTAQDSWYADSDPARQPEPTAQMRAESSLHAAEDRLAAEAAAAASASTASGASGRSKGIFLALGGIAVAGLAIIGGGFFFGSGKKATPPGGVPVIAARNEPTKEKPSDPGGMDIPNQNKQVLAARNTPEAKPAQVVNTTEQPLDLNQVTRRDSVRVIAPSPFQGSPPPAGAPPALAQPGASDPSSVPTAGNGLVEPRRVTSVRIPVGGSDPAPAPAPATATTRPPAASVTGTAGSPASPPVAAARPATPPPTLAVPPIGPRPETPAPTAKVETRPVTAQASTETPNVTPPKVAAAPAAPPPRAPAPRAPNAPLSLEPATTAAATPARPAAATGGSGFAIQLASRPTEADARAASAQLKTKYASILGARSPGVVSGEANGQTVYRVRVGGFGQADAVEACKKVMAAGGGCFVTRQ